MISTQRPSVKTHRPFRHRLRRLLKSDLPDALLLMSATLAAKAPEFDFALICVVTLILGISYYAGGD